MGTSIDKKAARFGRWGLGIPKNIRKGTDKYNELNARSRRRLSLILTRLVEALRKNKAQDKVWSAYDKAFADLMDADGRPGYDYDTMKLIQKYRKSSIFNRSRIAALLREHLAQWRKQRERRRLLRKQYTILKDLYDADAILLVALIAHKHGYGVYSDVMPIWYKHVLLREMPAIVRKKMLLLQKGYKINPNPSDFGNAVVFSRLLPGRPSVYRRNLYNKPIASNADPFVPGMLYGAKTADGIAALLRGKDVWFTPHRDVLLGYSDRSDRNYTVTLNPEALAVAGYRSDGKPLLTPHIADDIYSKGMRSAILKGTYTGGRTAGRSNWGNRPDYLAVAYLKPLREGAKNWRNTGLFRVFSKSKESDTGWLLVQPIITRDKYEHFRRL